MFCGGNEGEQFSYTGGLGIYLSTLSRKLDFNYKKQFSKSPSCKLKFISYGRQTGLTDVYRIP